MKSAPLFFLVSWFAWVIGGVVRYFPWPTLPVDVVWLIVLFLGFHVPLFPGGLAVLLLGLAQEAVGAPLHGATALAALVVFFFLRLTHNLLFFQRRTSQIVWVLLLTLAGRGIEMGLLAWQGYDARLPFEHLLAQAFLNGLASLALFPLLKLPGRIERRRSVY